MNMFIDGFVNRANQDARRNEYRNIYMAPEDFYEDFSPSPQA